MAPQLAARSLANELAKPSRWRRSDETEEEGEQRMYVILTSKTGIFRTELGPGLRPVEAYEYSFFDRVKARFVIAEIEGAPKITVVEDEPPHVVNRIPSKFLQKYQTLEAARSELQHLVKFRDMEVKLEQMPVAAGTKLTQGPGAC